MAIRIREEDRKRATVEQMQAFTEQCKATLLNSKLVKGRTRFSVSDSIRQLKHLGVTNHDYARKLLRLMVEDGTLVKHKEKGKNSYTRAQPNLLKLKWDKTSLEVLTRDEQSV